ncbi:hypothetical protein [Dyadobacter fermentans]|uniref:hypothetical protein n=1 Tax=Dyadobacter fermentans TaxID=94254 RepID=UPI001CC16E01|nr:hypothetical protein [Dyadobacter fermentans]MBZ1361986.1 hypothetical protein [Dyadobacter fermentans]
MKKLLLLLLVFAAMACKEKVKVVPVQRTLNGTEWKKYEVRRGDRDVFKILTFKAPNIVNISVRDDHGYVFAEFQKEYTYMYEHPNFTVFDSMNDPHFGRFMEDDVIEMDGEIFLKSK